MKDLDYNNFIKEKKPFPYFSIENFFDEIFSKNLKKEFLEIYENEISKFYNKKESIFKKTDSGNLDYDKSFYIGGGKEKDSLKLFLQLSQKYPYLDKLIKKINNQKFTDYIFNLLEKKVLWKKNVLRDPNYKLNFFEFIFFNNFYINFKISYFKNKSGLALHRDHGGKEIALLYYLGFSDNLTRKKGGTQLYKKLSKTKYQDHNIEEDKLNDFIKIFDHEPKNNSLLGFKRTENSWHAVEQMELPLDVVRMNLQINFMRLDDLKYSSILVEKLKYRIVNFKLFLFKIINNEN